MTGGETVQGLVDEWQRALAGNQSARDEWAVAEGGNWAWSTDGVALDGAGAEWAAFGWRRCAGAALGGLTSLSIAVTVSGQAEAAGLSFGPYKDFLVDLGGGTAGRRLQLEVDATAGSWLCRADGQPLPRHWWDSALRGVDDLLGGMLTFKALRAGRVVFSDLTIIAATSSCRVSVIMTCHRFLQRLRVSLRNWCHQEWPPGGYEILVVNPQSPDGTREHLAAVARSFPHLRIREIGVEPALALNKGAMLNRGVAASRGEWIWFTDADCLFPPNGIMELLPHLDPRRPRLYYGQRRYLSASQTDALLAGRSDGLRDFAALVSSADARPPENAPWGYTQIVHRSTLARVRYEEHLNHFAHTDGIFTESCRRNGVAPRQVPGLVCLHLDHPFAWYGTDIFL